MVPHQRHRRRRHGPHRRHGAAQRRGARVPTDAGGLDAAPPHARGELRSHLPVRLPRRITFAIAVPVTVVLALYAFYCSDGTFQFRRVTGRAEYDRERVRFGLGYYPSLAE